MRLARHRRQASRRSNRAAPYWRPAPRPAQAQRDPGMGMGGQPVEGNVEKGIVIAGLVGDRDIDRPAGCSERRRARTSDNCGSPSWYPCPARPQRPPRTGSSGPGTGISLAAEGRRVGARRRHGGWREPLAFQGSSPDRRPDDKPFAPEGLNRPRASFQRLWGGFSPARPRYCAGIAGCRPARNAPGQRPWGWGLLGLRAISRPFRQAVRRSSSRAATCWPPGLPAPPRPGGLPPG